MGLKSLRLIQRVAPLLAHVRLLLGLPTGFHETLRHNLNIQVAQPLSDFHPNGPPNHPTTPTGPTPAPREKELSDLYADQKRTNESETLFQAAPSLRRRALALLAAAPQAQPAAREGGLVVVSSVVVVVVVDGARGSKRAHAGQELPGP
jgi:hypothetical protein